MRQEDGLVDEPKPAMPAHLSGMTPEDAWNAALEAAHQIAEYSAFWDDGRSAPSEILALRVEPSPGDPS